MRGTGRIGPGRHWEGPAPKLPKHQRKWSGHPATAKGQTARGLPESPENSIAPRQRWSLIKYFVKAKQARPATVYREALPSLTVSVKTLGRGSSVRAARARMYMVSRALASLGFRVSKSSQANSSRTHRYLTRDTTLNPEPYALEVMCFVGPGRLRGMRMMMSVKGSLHHFNFSAMF